MLPTYEDDLRQDFTFEEQPSRTFKLDRERNVIDGYVDGLEAVEQAIYLILQTERYSYEIYSWNYGSELTGLIGAPSPLVYSLVKGYITDALMQDDRILGVDDFDFTREREKVHVSFTVTTTEGAVEAETEVNV